MKPAVVLFAGGLAACATQAPEPRMIPEPYPVPVAVRCAPEVPSPPDYPDTDARLRAAPSLFARVQALLAGRDVRSAEVDQLRAALKGCAGVP